MESMPLLTERITHELRNQVLQMRCDTMVKIPSERELTEIFNASRPSIRLAIKNLISEGLLIQEQGKGTYVTPKIKIHTLDIICSPDIKRNDPFYNSFLVEITKFAAKQSMNLFIVDYNQIMNTYRESPLVIVGSIDDSVLELLKKVYKTIIAFQSYPDHNEFTQIYFDHYKIGYMAANILAKFNHKNVIHFAGPEKYVSALNRKVGFEDAMKKLHNNYRIITEKMNWAGGYKAGDVLINEYTDKNRPTAVFVANDWMGIGLIQKLKENGLRIPEDISIVGCDDIPLASEFSPTLATFSLDMKVLINELFAALNVMHSSDYYMGKKILLSPTFIPRDSLKANGKKRS